MAECLPRRFSWPPSGVTGVPVRDRPLPSMVGRASPQARVEVEKAVADAPEVVDALGVGPRLLTDAPPLGGGRDERFQACPQVVLRRGYERNAHAERLLRAAH